jgi:hypothetical protein
MRFNFAPIETLIFMAPIMSFLWPFYGLKKQIGSFSTFFNILPTMLPNNP